jgi:hypothetical protein
MIQAPGCGQTTHGRNPAELPSRAHGPCEKCGAIFSSMKTGTPTLSPNGGHPKGCSKQFQVLQAKAPVASTPAASLNRGRVPR